MCKVFTNGEVDTTATQLLVVQLMLLCRSFMWSAYFIKVIGSISGFEALNLNEPLIFARMVKHS